MPDIRVDVRERVTGVGIYELDVHVERHTLLVFGHILADQFTSDVCPKLVKKNTTMILLIVQYGPCVTSGCTIHVPSEPNKTLGSVEGST